MVKELSEDLSSIKKTQSETKDTLIEIKNNLQGNNRMDKDENQINDLEHKQAKTKTKIKKNKQKNPNQSEQEGKRIKQMRVV